MENDNKININQAYYGEVSRSHGCIASSLDDENLKSYLIGFSDKPSRIPFGIILEEYYSANKYSSYFIFAKTLPDPTASRAGMVFTHVLIVNIEDTESINDLSSLLSNFVRDIPDKLTNIEPLFYHSTSQRLDLLPDIYPAYIQLTVQYLIKGEKAAFFGEVNNFITTVVTIWNGLPPLMRKSLTYTIAFASDDIENKKEPLLFFQKQLIEKISYAYKINDSDDGGVTISDSVEHLVLGKHHLNRFNDFLITLNLGLKDFKQLTIAEKAYELCQKIDELTADDVRQAIRLIAKLSPGKEDGFALKQQLVFRLGEFIKQGKDYNIKALRNVLLDGFPNAESTLSQKIEGFITDQFVDKLRFDVTIISDVINLSSEGDNSFWWNTAVSKALVKAFTSPMAWHNIWLLLTNVSANLTPIFEFIVNDKKQEDLLIANFPISLSNAVGEKLKPFFRSRHWYRSYAHCSMAYLDLTTAFKEQLGLEKKTSFEESIGVLLIANKLSDDQLLNFYLVEPDEKTLILLKARIIMHRSILRKIDLNNDRWLTVWAAVLPDIKQFEIEGIEMQTAAKDLFNLICNMRKVPNEVVVAYSLSKYADLSGFENRQAFWISVPEANKAAFVSATANGYAERIVNSTPLLTNLEPELENLIKSDQFITRFLSKHRMEMGAVIAFYNRLSLQKDHFLADYISYYNGDISDLTSAELGSLVSNNSFRQSAPAVFNKAKNNKHFRVALNKCKALLNLGIFDRVIYGHLFGEALNDQTAYDGLLELVKQLYNKGPEDNDIWERSGGDNNKLVSSLSREENWRKAIQLVRYGGGGKELTVKSLLKEIQKDFPEYPATKVLLDYFKN